MNTCRFCKKRDTRKMFKYAARHWAHFKCWLWHTAPLHEAIVQHLSGLHSFVLRQFPVAAVDDWLREFGCVLDKSKIGTDAMRALKDALRIAQERESATVSEK